MNKFTDADRGKAAILTRTNGDTFSVSIMTVQPTRVCVTWRTGPHSFKGEWLELADLHRLDLFPAGAMFAAL